MEELKNEKNEKKYLYNNTFDMCTMARWIYSI